MPPNTTNNITIRQLNPPSPATTAAINSSFHPGTSIPPRPSPSTSTSTSVPSLLAFHDCIAVRVPVFVHEQASPYAEEIDTDDSRSWHWTAYTTPNHPPPPDPTITAISVQPPSTTSEHPVATIRLVPGPHSPHPLPGSELFNVSATNPTGGGSEANYPATVRPRIPGKQRDVGTAMHDGRELYVKLGRLATLKEARGQGLARRLIETALEWAGSEGRGKLDCEDGEGSEDVGREWRGMVLVHAQTEVAPLYRRCGFVEDPELGSWMEGGIPHVAMWKRVELRAD